MLTSVKRYRFPLKGETRQAALTHHSYSALYLIVLTNAIKQEDKIKRWIQAGKDKGKY